MTHDGHDPVHLSVDEGAQPAPPRSPSARGQPGGVQSVDRAMLLMEMLAQSGGGATLTDLSNRTRLNISTCHHLLATLMRSGYVAKVPGRRTYSLGARVLHLGHAFLRQVDVPRKAEPVLERLSRGTGETVHMAVLQGDKVVTVARKASYQAVRVDSGIVGAAEAAHATATGKAILAWLPESQMKLVLGISHGQDLPRFTENTITHLDDLVEELRHVRRNGHAIDCEEYQAGVICVGAAVRDHAGAVIGSISASAPSFRAQDAQLEALRMAVIAAAGELSAEIGAPPPSGAE